ncbi:PAS domain S-box protein [Geobacter sp. FeAm09]|uniref:PAS domain-containing protein n=1 Tax=Geobacter sp. FeAm09 TaxID=2597769 RepID=UPI00143DF679|nr:PAS domain S-box protein [Geobacter sp. FeAm09]
MTLKSFQTRLILICVLPLVILAAYLSFDRVRSLQDQRAQEAANLVRNYAASLDRLLNARIAALQMLAASSSLTDAHRLGEFYQESQAFLKNFGSHVLLADLSSHMILNTRLPYGAPLPDLPRVKGHSSVAAVLATGKPAVGDTFMGPINKAPLVSLAVPVKRNGRISRLLLSIMETRQFQERLDEFSLPAGFAITLLDGTGAVIARRLPPGGTSDPNLDGYSGRIVIKSAVAPWSVQLAVHRDTYRLPLYTASAALAAALLGATLISVLVGMLAGRELAGSVASLTEPAASPSLRPPIAEIETVRRVLVKATTARAEEEAIRRASDERYRSLVESAPAAIFIHRDDRIEYANPAAIRLFGGDDAGEVVGRSPYAFVHPAYHDVMAERIGTLLHGGSTTLTEMRIIQAGGGERIVEVIGTTCGDDQLGTAIQVMMCDITERKRAEEDRARLESRLRQI